MNETVWNRICDAARFILIAVLICYLLIAAVPGLNLDKAFLGGDLKKISEDSAGPYFKKGDYILTSRLPSEQIAVGDMIFYLSKEPEFAGMSRVGKVVELLNREGTLSFRIEGGEEIPPEYTVVSELALQCKIRGKSNLMTGVWAVFGSPWMVLLGIAAPILMLTANKIMGFLQKKDRHKQFVERLAAKGFDPKDPKLRLLIEDYGEEAVEEVLLKPKKTE